jgi:hypothetical protein
LLTVGGLFGNFLLSVTDHAANGFFHWTEWMPVVSSALAVGFLLLPFVVSVTTSYLAVCAGVLLLQVPVGLLGFFFHARADFYGPSKSLFENVLNGAPPMAPLLLPNLVLLGLIALWTYGRSLPEPLSGSPVPGNVHNE